MADVNLNELENSLHVAKRANYMFTNCYQYYQEKRKYDSKKFIVFRVDVDYDLEAAPLLLDVFRKFGIKATFFLRMYANEYNVFSKKSEKIISLIKSEMHEIGVHTELMDIKKIYSIKSDQVLKDDIKKLEEFYNIKIFGSACHRERDGENNLLFWQENSSKKFNLKYEAYDQEKEFGLFHNSFYISDSEWHNWKNYENGKKVESNYNLTQAIYQEKKRIYLLVHTDTFGGEKNKNAK
jgi:hypothetical protein